MAITFGRKGFRAYLEAQPPGVIVGYANKELSCPLAQYAKAQGAIHCAVGGREITYYLDKNSPAIYQFHPPWRRTFIRRIDRVEGGLVDAPISREQALAVLDAAEGATR